MSDLTSTQTTFVDGFILDLPSQFTAPAEGTDPDRLRTLAAKARSTWNAAKDDVDTQLRQLQAVLKDFDDPNCQDLAKNGLGGFTDGLQVAMLAALFDVEKASADSAADSYTKLLKTIAQYQAMIRGNQAMTLLESFANREELSVSLDLRSRFGTALSRMQKTLFGAV